MSGEGSAREKVLESSIFLRCELGDSAASADVARQARVECFSSEEASFADGKLCAVLQRFFSHFGPLFFEKSFLLRRLHVRSYQDIPLQASRNTNVRRWRKEHPTR